MIELLRESSAYVIFFGLWAIVVVWLCRRVLIEWKRRNMLDGVTVKRHLPYYEIDLDELPNTRNALVFTEFHRRVSRTVNRLILGLLAVIAIAWVLLKFA